MSEASGAGIAFVREKFADSVLGTEEHHGQTSVTVKAGVIHDVVEGLKKDAGFDFLDDLGHFSLDLNFGFDLLDDLGLIDRLRRRRCSPRRGPFLHSRSVRHGENDSPIDRIGLKHLELEPVALHEQVRGIAQFLVRHRLPDRRPGPCPAVGRHALRFPCRARTAAPARTRGRHPPA